MKNGKVATIGVRDLNDEQVDAVVRSIAGINEWVMQNAEKFLKKKISKVELDGVCMAAKTTFIGTQVGLNIMKQSHRPNRGGSSKSKTFEMAINQTICHQDTLSIDHGKC